MKKSRGTIVAMKSLLALSVAAAGLAHGATIEEVVVTAQKREQNLQDVPVSVTAVTGATLQNSGVTDLTRLELLTPGLQFGQSGNDARPAIRGARTENVSNQQDPIVAFFVDGVYRSRTAQALAAFVDVDRVEVLRGPQGTLFGRNSFGGAINVISNKPTMDNEYGAAITVGNYDQRRIEGYFNAPLGDTLALRVAASIDQHDFYIENSFNSANGFRDKDEDYLRAQLAWDASDNVSINFSASTWTQGGNGGSDFGFYLAGTPLDANGGGFTTIDEILNADLNPVNPRVGGGNAAADSDPYSVARDFKSTLDTEQDTFDIDVNWDLDDIAVKLLVGYSDFSSYRDADTDLSIQPSGLSGQVDTAKTYSGELQVSSASDSALQWTVGAYLLEDETSGTFLFDRFYNTDGTTNTPILTSPAPTSDFNARGDIDTSSVAIYGQATFELTERMRLTGGLRWTDEEKDFKRWVNFAYTSPLVFTPAQQTLDTSESFSEVNWKVGVDFDLTESSLLYLTAATGFQSGGFNTSADPITGSFAFDAQTITAYELGSKNVLLDDSLQLNVALYMNQFDDMLANAFVNTGTTVVTISTNAGEATAYGLELEADWLPTENSKFNVRASWNNAEFGTYVLTEPVSGISVDLDGSRIPMTPDFTLGLGGEYDIAVEGGRVTPAFNIYYSSDYSTNDFDYAFGEQDAYTKLDLTLTYNADKGWYVQAYGRNVTDEETINRTVRFGQNAIVHNWSDPATYGVRVGFNY